MNNKFSILSPQLVAAVCNAGAIGMMGSTHLNAAEIQACAKSIRKLTNGPFAFNSLMFLSDEAGFAAALETRPAVISLSWPRRDQDVSARIKRAHDVGCKVTYMASDVPEAVRGAEAGAADEAPLFYGQDAGLIEDILPAATIIERLVANAESQITANLAHMSRR